MGDDTPSDVVQRLFLRHANVLRGFIQAFMPGSSAVEDVLQETFLTLIAHAHELRVGSDFLDWARAVARFKVLEQRRRDRRWPGTLSMEAEGALVAAAGELDEKWEARETALVRCMEKLAPKARRIVELRYSVAKPRIDSVAREVAWSPGAVKVALSRARAFLMDCVDRQLRHEGAAGDS